MQKFILLFRGVNVGGNNLLPMKPFVTLLERNNYQAVSSYIQSGNIILESSNNPTEEIRSIVLKNYGFSPELFLLNESEFSQAATNSPYKEYEGKFVHLYFCQNIIKLNLEKLTKFIAESEEYQVIHNTFYLHAPNGIGRSKLVSNIASCLGQTATGRNLNTINKISLLLNN